MGRWLSQNEGKAWTERWFLLYSPVWMAAMGLVMAFGLHRHLDDLGYTVLGLVLALPVLLVPALMSPENRDRPFHETYWFKANVYLLNFSVFGSYFGSEYFFDVLGMVYDYPNLDWTFDSALVGSGQQVVPLIMYPTAFFYFMTYHASASVVLRRIRTSGLPGIGLLFPIVVFVVGYFWAWTETRLMANPMIEENFYYEKMDVMLAYGSAIYAIYFICSFPIYHLIDENKARPWSIWVTLAASFSASMLTFYGLDLAAMWVGSL